MQDTCEAVTTTVTADASIHRQDDSNIYCGQDICECATAVPSDTNERCDLALQLHQKFFQNSDLDAAQQCIEQYEALLSETKEPIPFNSSIPNPEPRIPLDARPKLHHILIGLADIYVDRYRHNYEQCDLELAVQYGKEALSMCRTAGIRCPTVLGLFANILDSNADDVSRKEDRIVAESLCREAISLCATGTYLAVTVRLHLAWTLLGLFMENGSHILLDEAIDIQRQALVDLSPSHCYDRHRPLRFLGVYLRHRYHMFGKPEDLDECLDVSAQAVHLCPKMHIDRCKTVNEMLWSLYLKTLRSNAINELNKAIELGLNTLKEVSGAGMRRAGCLSVVLASTSWSSLWITSWILWARSGHLLAFRHQLAPSDGRDLDKSVTLSREALRLCPPNRADYWVYVDRLALGLLLQYNWTGEISHLEESIQLGRSTIDSMPTTHAQRFIPARGLARSLMLRFNETRRISDLDEAIKWDRRALASSGTSHVFYPEISAQAVSRLCMLFDARGSFEALEEAITLSNTVLDTMASDSVQRSDVILELSKALLRRGRHQGNVADIDRSISKLARIKEVMLQRTGGPELLSTLADCHIVRFRFNRSFKDANDALETMTGLLDKLPPEYPGRTLAFSQCSIRRTPGRSFSD